MKQNTVIAAVSFGLFLTMFLSSLGGDGKKDQEITPEDFHNDEVQVASEYEYGEEEPSNDKAPLSEVAMENNDWWNDAELQTDRLTEEEMVEMLESLWGPDGSAPSEEGDVSEMQGDEYNPEESDTEENINPEDADTEELSRTKSLTASILHLGGDESEQKDIQNKADPIERGGEKQVPETSTPQDPQNLTADIFVEKTPESKPEPKPSVPDPKPKPAVIEKAEKPKPAIPEVETSFASQYKDGTYSALGKYSKGESQEEFLVTFTIKNDIVQSFSLVPRGSSESEKNIQNLFYNDVSPYITGERLGNIPQFSSLGGGSQVPVGFHRALGSIRTQAKN